MIFALTSWLIITFILGLAAHFAIWARTGQHKPRLYSVVTLFGGSFVAAGAVFISMGWSTPCSLLYNLRGDPLQILAYSLVPEETIYLYLDMAHGGPRVCSVDWSTDMANRLEQNAKNGGSELKMGGDGDGGGMFGEPDISLKLPRNGPAKN